MLLSSGASMRKEANTKAKNRVEHSQLSTALNRIEKEKQAEMRMLNTEKQRFKAKYTKINPVSSETSEIKMYETHTPGFCFKRNGEQRLSQPIVETPSINLDHLHFLLFTNGEVDIEKVLCLHLLSSHETKHLTPPKPHHLSSSSFLKKDSPLEQLIERSKEHQMDSTTSSSSLLRTYILDVNKQPVHLKKDQRLVSRLIVNEKILELITTVMRALEQSNPEKVQDLLSIAEDPSRLKRIFNKPYIQEFMVMLKENSLINSCSSFILTEPTKEEPNHIEIRTPTGALEDLVRFIRANVLQFPTRASVETIEETKNLVLVLDDNPAKMKSIDVRRISSPKFRTEVLHKEPSRIIEEEEEEINPFRHVVQDFVAKNIAAASKYKREKEEILPPKRARRPSTDSKRESVNSSVGRTSLGNFKEFSNRGSASSGGGELRVHSKQTTCPACMEKWKIPLPLPKVSKSMNNPNNTANQQQRISMLIHKEQVKLDSYERKYSNASSSSAQNWGGRRRSNITSDSTDQMDLNLFDLEKIRQEIREKETKKKLERFLND